MNVEFKDAITEHVVKQEEITVNGEAIGEMNTRDDGWGSKYHAVIKCAGGSISIIQGHGETKIEAIQKAISTGRSEAETRLADIAELEKKLGLR